MVAASEFDTSSSTFPSNRFSSAMNVALAWKEIDDAQLYPQPQAVGA